MENRENKVNEDYKKYYEKIEKIGKGGFGDVWKARLKSDKKEIRALKFIDLNDIRLKIKKNIRIKEPEKAMEKNIKYFRNEIKNMQLCSDNNRNENSVRYHEHFESKDEFVIVMELCDTDLVQILKQKEGFSIIEILKIMNQLNNTFKIMRKNNIVHRDLKLENILVKYKNAQKSDFLVKLSDYGISKKVTDTTMCYTHAGTSIYMAPEIIKGGENEGEKEKNIYYDEKCDLWSIGIMLYQMFFNDDPYKAENENALLKKIQLLKNKVINDKKNTGDRDLDNLIQNLLIEDPRERITWDAYFNHAFFKDEKNSEISIKILVTEKYKNKKIYFLENNANKDEEKFTELNNYNTEIYINNKIQKEFNKFFIPDKEGEYTIKLIIKNKITNCRSMFFNCENITSIDLSSFGSSKVTNTSEMFYKCFELREIIFGDFNTKNVINMERMFAKCKQLKKIDFPKSFVTENVTNMDLMFFGCETLEEINISFDTSKVTNMHGLFQECYLLKNLDLSSFKTDKVIDMSQMFLNCCNLTEIKIDPKNFNTTNVKNMSRMFSNCSSLQSFKFSGFRTDNVEFMCGMFNRCEKLENIDLSNFNTKKLKNMNYMFNDCINVRKIKLSSFTDKGDLEKKNLFTNCKNLKAVFAEQIVQKDFENIQFKKL